MDSRSSLLAIALAAGFISCFSGTLRAAPITYDFTGAVSGNQALGGSHVYTAIGGPNLTAISGSYGQSGSGAPVSGSAFTAGGQLVGNNRGSDEQGVGVCLGTACNNGHL